MVGARHGHGMASVNQTRPHCVNQMGKTHSKPLSARHGRGTAWARHAMCESAFNSEYFGVIRLLSDFYVGLLLVFIFTLFCGIWNSYSKQINQLQD